jgi:hypothetical protein
LLPIIGAIAGVVLALVIGTGGGTEDDPWTVTVVRFGSRILRIYARRSPGRYVIATAALLASDRSRC